MKQILLTAFAAVALAATVPAAVLASGLTGDAEDGREIFAGQCRSCHSGSIAPKLTGVFGRAIAGNADYANYSPGLQAKHGETWTAQSLDAFLAAPTTFAPGSTMPTAVADAQRRADIIAYLISLSEAD